MCSLAVPSVYLNTHLQIFQIFHPNLHSINTLNLIVSELYIGNYVVYFLTFVYIYIKL